MANASPASNHIRPAIAALILWSFLFIPAAGATPKKAPKLTLSPQTAAELKAKDDELAEKIEELQAQLDVMTEQYRMLVQRTSLVFLNQFYLRAGLTFISPRLRSASGIRADPGMGGFFGLGQYFGKSHVADLAIEWDIYPSISLRYRYEFHYDNPSVTLAPVAGVKVRAVHTGPLDNSIDRSDLLPGAFAFVGGMLGIPLGRVLFTLEMVYLFPRQNFLNVNLGAQFMVF